MDMTYLKYPVYFLSGSLLITAITLIAEKKSQKVAVWNPIGAIADLVYLGFFAIGINIPGYTAAGLYSCMVWLLYPSYGIITGTLASYIAVFVFLSMLFYGEKL